jgi:hypothetical protein
MFMSDAGYICEIRRHKQFGHLCGYIYIPFGHPDFGRVYERLQDCVDGHSPYVHGGWTYSDTRGDDDGGKYTVFGFDCNNAYDYSPGYPVHHEQTDQELAASYRTIEFVTNQLEQAAKQFKERAGP